MTSPVHKLAADLRAGKAIYSHWCGIPSPQVPGLLAQVPGYDCVIIDTQHNPIDFAATVAAIPLVAAAGLPCVVRVQVGDFPTAGRYLDAGAAGIIAPLVNTVADARAFVAATKYPPLGQRSWGPVATLSLTGLDAETYFKTANGFAMTFAMIETREALDILDDILAVEGLDGVFIGPSDLSISLSGGAKLDASSADVDKALDHVAARAKAAGKFCGAYVASGARAAKHAKMGFQLMGLGGDAVSLKLGAAEMLKATQGA